MKQRRIKHKFRHELKFIIGRKDALLLQKKLEPFLELDPFSVDEAMGYRVSSLYFDDYKRTAYFDKLNGAEDRTKYRLRVYNFGASPITLEAKIKKGDLSRKESVRLNMAEYRELVGNAGEIAMAVGMDGGKTSAGGEFTNYFDLLRKVRLMRPQIIVDYWRRAFIGRESDVRLTFDDGLQISHATSDILQADGHAWQTILEADELILEVKYDNFLPAHLSQLLVGFPLHKIAVSKYVLCQQVARRKNLGFSLQS
ncbi:polyphosphate polymerase domain-containing protein [Microgenomates group bacterium]|nr:polyphosphate polymerase domain-containing protein [Microgenomates group bacterium]